MTFIVWWCVLQYATPILKLSTQLWQPNTVVAVVMDACATLSGFSSGRGLSWSDHISVLILGE